MKLVATVARLLPLLLASTAAWGTEPSRFTPQVMLQNQDVGEVRFSADGRTLYLDKHLAYRDKGRFDRDRDWSRGLSVLSAVDLQSDTTTELRSDQEDRTWYLGTSPDGRYLAFGWFDQGIQRIGIRDRRDGREQRLPLAGTTSPFPVTWVSSHQFVATSMAPEWQRRAMAYNGEALRRITELSARSWQGEASLAVVGSGRYQPQPNEEPVSLSLVDARSGQVMPIDEGTIGMVMAAAPGGQRLAYLRKVGTLDMAGARIQAIIAAEALNELVVYDLERGPVVVPMCAGCSVSDGSLRWSPQGAQLYFSARSREGEGFRHHHYLYDARGGKASAFEVPGLAWDIEVERARLLAPVMWVDESHLAIRTRNPEAREFENQAFRWHLVTRDGEVLRELTAGLPRGDDKRALAAIMGVHDGAALMIADGQLWRLPVDGQANRMSVVDGLEVDSWCAPYAPWRPWPPRCDTLSSDPVVPQIDAAALARGQVTLRLMHDDLFTGELAFLDLGSGEVTRLQRPSADSVPLEASALTRTAVYQRKADDGDEILVATAGQAPVSVHRFNTHLAGVRAATPVLLTRREAGEDEDRNDWLLLPPGHRDGDRHPLLVYFYPDTQYRKELKRDDLRDTSFLNMNIPTARGYAVLLATMKISDYGTAGGNPMREMHEQLIRAAENAAAKGYVDPERWAIMGHSYGGYGTNSVITQTGRFKAAVSLAGKVNLTSGYGTGMNTDKVYSAPEGLNFGALWSEGGQGRMGVPPWVDPQRYIDNSPLFSAQHITTPLLLLHGDLDFVNVNEAEQLFVALHRQGKDVQLVRYWGEGHTLKSPGNIEDMWERIFVFLDENLGPTGGAVPHAASASAAAEAGRPGR